MAQTFGDVVPTCANKARRLEASLELAESWDNLRSQPLQLRGQFVVAAIQWPQPAAGCYSNNFLERPLLECLKHLKQFSGHSKVLLGGVSTMDIHGSERQDCRTGECQLYTCFVLCWGPLISACISGRHVMTPRNVSASPGSERISPQYCQSFPELRPK